MRTRPGLLDFFLVPIAFLAVGLWLQGDGRTPHGDSWCYAWTARQFLDHGRFAFCDTQAMTLVGQVLLVAPVAAVFSTAPSVLNHFTLVLSAATLSLFLWIFREVGLGRASSLVGVATLAVNPLWLTQSMAYETEIPFLFFSALGTLALVRQDRNFRSARSNGGDANWPAALAFAGAASVRQHALVFPAAWLVYALRARRLTIRSCVPWLIPPLVVATIYLGLYASDGVPRAFRWQTDMVRLRWSDPQGLAASLGTGCLAAFHYLGLFLLPVTIVAAGRLRKPGFFLGASLLLVAATLTAWVGHGQTMPYLPHLVLPELILAPLGLGHRLDFTNLVLTFFSTVAGIGLVAALFRMSRSDRRELPPVLVFFAATAVLFLAFNLVFGLGFDRYFLPLLPFVIPVLLYGHTPSAGRLPVVVSLLMVMLAGSMLLVDQRLRTATCQWDAAESLLRAGNDAGKINGGAAFNGHYLYDAMSRSWEGRKHELWVPWFQPEAEYLVTTRSFDRDGLTLVGTRTCPNLPGFHDVEVRTYSCSPRRASETASQCQPL